MSDLGQVEVLGKTSRKPHRKTRTGCAVCKKRRIKCDENKPACRNCLLFNVGCTYSSVRPAVSGERLIFLVNDGPGPHRGRGRPRTNWPERASAIVKVASPYNSLCAALPSLVEGTRAYSMLLECLKWTGDTTVMTSREQIIRKGPSTVLGMSYPFIFDLVRSVVASHLVQQLPQHREHFRALADSYSSPGIRGLTELLPHLDAKNAHAIFAAAALVCITILAQGPREGEYLFFNDGDSLTWIQLLKGLKSIPGAVGVDQVFSGPLRSFSCGKTRVDRPAVEILHLQTLDWVGQFIRLRDFIAHSNNATRVADLEALEGLELCYEANWGRADGSYEGDVMNKWAFTWAYHLQDDFVRRLQKKSPMPLVILAHFAVLLKTLEHVWWIAGWPQHIVSGIHAMIDRGYLHWLEWPARALAIVLQMCL
ncbi:Sterol regulatory element-binding protein ECM22-like protein 1 [Colletotrichum truncatum]|uniref:Sterol regulatory element-binding protein ECM22-like protein 1 n=1 Tax=Colletotrichum truncatum TaxID=5467 RepID=A0ACC3YF61_COLTU|nr:Sterol regulatory element-binding protein ECM22-like protein 1 [Colletotrichum truncatum]KAF6788205.1 Sterol regulatory element-binding protein ECM22-like protein 1 [Colletotrichum truncatum]